jgi:hypothetical protein
MSVYADYSAEEQQLLLRSLQAAAVAISAASLGRKPEIVSEGFAAASFIMERSADRLDNTLIGSVQFALNERVLSDQPFPDYGPQALATLRQVAALLAEKSTPAEANGYKEWLMKIAALTTEAGKEGGNFLGWGAVLVNDAEKAALAEVAAALGVER